MEQLHLPDKNLIFTGLFVCKSMIIVHVELLFWWCLFFTLINSLIFRRSARVVNTTYSTSRRHMRGCRQKTKVSPHYQHSSIFSHLKAILYWLAVHENIRSFSCPSFSILSHKAAWTVHYGKSRCRGWMQVTKIYHTCTIHLPKKINPTNQKWLSEVLIWNCWCSRDNLYQ